MRTFTSSPGTPLPQRLLCGLLALVMTVPLPGLSWAQDLGERPLGAGDLEREADLSGLDAVDVDPLTGRLLYGRDDLVVGEGEQAFAVRRTWRPWAGDRLGLGLHWATPLDVHLELGPDGERAAVTLADGERVFFAPTDGAGAGARGQPLVATAGPPARLERVAEGWRLTGLGDEREWRFAPDGALVARLGPAGVRLGFAYDAERRLLGVEGPWGRLGVERDAAGRVVALVGPGGDRVAYERDAEGNLARVVRGDLVAEYGYDAGARLVGLGGGLGAVRYDALGRVVGLGGDGLEPVRVQYLASTDPSIGRQALVTRGGETWQVAVSRDERRLELTSPAGLVTATFLDERERPVRVVTLGAGAPVERTIRYDERGRVAARTGPEGETRFAYGSRVTDRPTRIGLPDGRVVELTYDLRGNLLETRAPGGLVTRRQYDDAGRLVAETDARGATTRYERDERGHVVVQDEEGLGQTRFLRDAAGRIVKVKRLDGRVVDVTRDALGRARKVTDALGTILAVDYDRRGRVVRYQDELGQVHRYAWDARGRLDRVEDALGLVLAFTWDAGGRLAATRDAAGNETTWARPDARTLVVDDPTTGKRTQRFDALGRLVAETRGEQTVEYVHDALGRVVERRTPRGPQTFDYDRGGRLTRMTGPDGGFLLGYDEAGRLSRLVDAELEQGVQYAYDARGDRAELKLPWGAVRYEHDARGRVTAITPPDGGRLELAYLPDGRRKEVRYPNGVVTRYAYQGGRLSEVVTAKGEQVLDRRAWGWDARGRVAWSEDPRGKTTYAHDARGRLVAAEGPDGPVAWRYDEAGNVTAVVRGAEVAARELAPGNRLVAAGGARFAHDAAGALVARTVRAEAGAGSGEGARTTRYAYDADGKLVEATGPDGETTRWGYAPNGTLLWRDGPAGRTRYLNDLAHVVGELDAAGQVTTSWVHGPGADDALAASRGGASYYLHHDLQNSVTAITGADGALAARYAYRPWGETALAEGPAAAWNRLLYTGRPLDEATGLYDLRARRYDPTLGRFTTPDPLGVLGGTNLYAYAANDPALFTDPFGLRPWYARAWSAVTDTASSAVSWAAGVGGDVVDGLAYAGRQTLAFGKGFGLGLWGAAKGIVNTVLHPIDTVNGIIYAIEHWDETKEALLAKWEEYKDAAVNDPEKFAEMTGYLTAEILVSVAGTKGLDKLAKSSTLASAGRHVSNAGRVVTAPVTRATTRAGNALAHNFPRAAATVHRGRVISRARDLELAARAARGGNVFTRAGRRVTNFGRDVGAAGRLAAREPGAFLVYTGHRTTRAGAALVAASGRGMWTVTSRAGIPTVLVLDDAITDAIARTRTHEAALAAVERDARAFLDDAARLSPEELARRIDAVGRTYRDYRNRLLAPIHDEDKRLEARLAELNAAVERGEIPANTIDARLDAMLSEYGRRRHNLMVDLYDRNREEPHDMLRPSRNRTISFMDEVELLRAALERTRDPASRALLEARIADLEALMAHEYELFRAGEHDALIAGIAGPPRVRDDTPLPDGFDAAAWGARGDEAGGLVDTLDGLMAPGYND